MQQMFSEELEAKEQRVDDLANLHGAMQNHLNKLAEDVTLLKGTVQQALDKVKRYLATPNPSRVTSLELSAGEERNSSRVSSLELTASEDPATPTSGGMPSDGNPTPEELQGNAAPVYVD